MMYSSGRYATAGTPLEEAQAAKNESHCRSLQLRPDDHVLEIGTGWGGWSIHAARNHGCRVTTVTISREQEVLARARIAAAGLSSRIDVRLQDYRDIEGTLFRKPWRFSVGLPRGREGSTQSPRPAHFRQPGLAVFAD